MEIDLTAANFDADKSLENQSMAANSDDDKSNGNGLLAENFGRHMRLLLTLAGDASAPKGTGT
jgi:hypothetical protein